MSDYEFDEKRLKEEQAAFEAKKKLQKDLADFVEINGNGQHFGNFFLGRMNPHNNAGELMHRSADSMVSPEDRQRKTYERYKQVREAEKAKREDAEYEAKQEKIAKLRDPKSVESLREWKLLNAANPRLAKSLLGATGETIQEHTEHPLFKEVMENDRSRLVAGTRASERHNELIDKKVTNLAGDMSSSQNLARSIGEIESELGFNLDSYNPKSKKAIVGGKEKEVDLPGMSVPGIGRVSFYSPEARVLDGAAQKVFNMELKDRSGAAVTTPEMERLKREFAAGAFNSEEELITGMQRYKRALKSAMEDMERGANPDALHEYRKRGATTSEKLGYSGPKAGTGRGDGVPGVSSAQANNLKDPREMSEEELAKELGL